MNVNRLSQNRAIQTFGSTRVYNPSIYSHLRNLSHLKELGAHYDIARLKKVKETAQDKLDFTTIASEESASKKEVSKNKKSESEVKTSWLTRLGSKISDSLQRVQQVYVKAQPPTQATSLLQHDFIYELKKYLSYSELAHLEQTSKTSREEAKKGWIQEAQAYGYEGNDSTEAKNYLRELFSTITQMYKNNDIPEEHIAFKEVNGEKRVDPEEMLRKLKKLTTQELFKNFASLQLPKVFELLNKIKSECTTKKTELNKKDKIRVNNALIQAINGQNLELIKFILQQGGELNEILPNGETALTLACKGLELASLITISEKRKSAETEIVKLLLERGANPNVPNKNGHSPLSYAIKRGNNDVVELLKKHGAKKE